MAVKYDPDFAPRRINRWFSDAKFAADLDVNSPSTRFLIGANSAAGATGAICSGIAATAAASATLATAYEISDAQYGRCLNVVGSVGATTGATSTMTLYGLDYLGQPLSETVTLNGTATITTKKAFKWLTHYAVGAQAATVSIGISNTFGLPYRTIALQTDIVNGVGAATAGTVSAGADITLTQTATTSDPRGLYTPHTSLSPNGSRSYEILIICDVQGANIYGGQHFFS